ncbi:MAG: nucleotidyltransferase domain-containing protein [Candidatus Lokiarchaeota archaeon]|nr:nucleotidyltransferase domain-containing protein [Candidatus Lokiarchaeota archaeon]
MVEKKLIEQIRNDFTLIIEKKDIIGILIYGSYSKNQQINRSDIDICIVAPNEDSIELLDLIAGNVDIMKKKYDVRIFSELPLFMKIQIINDGILIYTLDKFDLYEFFYKYRKLWNDQQNRQELSKEELLTL